MINLTVVIDNDEAIRKFRELQKTAKTVTSSVVTDADRMDAAMQRFMATLGKIGVGVSLAGLVKQIAQTRGEFQQLEVAFTTLLRSKEKADALMRQMVDLAAKTPFDLQGVASGARQLLAYGFAAEDITDTLTRLGNVAAGLGLPLEHLTYLYGTTAVQGRVYARDMLQFTGSGIPILQEMAKMYGKTTEEINAMVSAGKIGFEDVRKVIENMTNEGGQFYNLMQESSKTITGLISNLGDAIDTMFNEIGKSQEGVIAGVLQGTISLVENYQKVLNILVPLVATYGAYKAALIVTAALQKASVTMSAVKTFFQLAKAIRSAADAQALFNLAVKSNPLMLALSLLVGLGTAIYRYAKGTNEAVENTLGLARANKKASDETDAETAKIKALQDVINNSNVAYSERKRALDELKGIVPDYHASLTSEGKLINNNTEAIKNYIKEFEKSVKLRAAREELEEAYRQQRKDMKEAEKVISAGTLTTSAGMYGGPSNNSPLRREYTEEEKKSIRMNAFLKTAATIRELNAEIVASSLAVEDSTGKTIFNVTENLKDAQKAYSDAKAALDKARRDGSDISVVKEKLNAVDNAKKALDEAKKLAGVDDKTINSFAKKFQKAYESARKEYNDFIIAQQKKLNDEEEALERSRITNKLELIEFDRQKTIEAIDEEEAAFIKLAEAYNKLAEAQGKPKVEVDTSEFARRRDIANMVASDDTAQALQEEKEAMNAYLAEYGSYQEKRLAITQTYADKIAQARTQGEKLSLQKEQEEALQALDLSMVETSNLWIRLFKDADAMANPSINRIIEDTERLLEYIDRVKGGKSADTSILDALGLSKKQVDALIADPEKIKDILDALKAKRDALNTRNPFGALIQGFKDLKDAAGDADKQMAAINKIIAGAQGAVQMLGDLGGSMSELGEAIGSDFVSGFGSAMSEIADVAGKTLNGALTGEALGGPVGAIIGAGVGLVTGIVGNISKRIAYNNKIRKEYQDTLRKEYLAEFEINALYRERYEWAKKIGEATLSYLRRDSAELDKQIKANAEEQEELLAKLKGSEFVAKEEYKHGTWFRKAKITKRYSQLWGKTWEEIELLAAQDRLTEEAKEYYEALKAAKEEGEDLQKQLEQLAEETREAFTGIGFDSLVDGIVNGFKEGKRSAADFADDFEELMQNAVLQSLKMNALEYPLRKWYEDFANAADDNDGLTAEEIKQLKEKYESIIRNAADQLEQLEGITGVDIGTAQQQASSNSFQTMSQDTGNELKGRFTAIAEYTASIRDTVNSILLQGGQQLNETINIRDIAIQLNGNVAIIKGHTSHLEEMDDKLGRMVKIMNEKL